MMAVLIKKEFLPKVLNVLLENKEKTESALKYGNPQ